MKIGLVGMENSHAEHAITYLNIDGRQPGVALTHVLADDPGRGKELTAVDTELQFVAGLDELVELVDAVIVCDRDGARHPANAAPFLARGAAAFVDKPLATTADDARRLVRLAGENGAVLVSHSPLRFTDGWREITQRCAVQGPPTSLRLTGPADPDGPWGGLFFYGIHLTDPVMALLATDFKPPEVRRLEDRVVATTQIGPTALELVFTRPDGPASFEAAVGWNGGPAETVPLTLSADYVAPGLDDFFAAVAGHRPAPDEAELCRPIALLEQIRAGLDLTAHR